MQEPSAGRSPRPQSVQACGQLCSIQTREVRRPRLHCHTAQDQQHNRAGGPVASPQVHPLTRDGSARFQGSNYKVKWPLPRVLVLSSTKANNSEDATTAEGSLDQGSSLNGLW